MTARRRPWVRGELGWLTSGPVWRVRADTLDEVDAFLLRHGYERHDLDGTVMTSRAAIHAALAATFAFPDWYGGNWDAFADCIRETVGRLRGGRLAIVWHDYDRSATAAPASAAEGVWALVDLAFGEHREALVTDVFVVGSGPDFDGPRAPVVGATSLRPPTDPSRC